MDRYSDARAQNRNLDFQRECLILLERIATALENPPRTIEIEPLTGGCVCGENIYLECSRCSPARLAWLTSVRRES